MYTGITIKLIATSDKDMYAT